MLKHCGTECIEVTTLNDKEPRFICPICRKEGTANDFNESREAKEDRHNKGFIQNIARCFGKHHKSANK